jgi:type IV pilus assembly protein PilV
MSQRENQRMIESVYSSLARNASAPTSGRQVGFTMLESLVSILVFSIGLLGLAALQSTAKQASFEASQRTQAAYLANDIIERMRTNRSVLDSYAPDDGDMTKVGGGSIEAAPSPDCASSTCTPAQMATRDLWAWEQAVDGAAVTESGTSKGGLVSPTGCIRQTNGGQIFVAIAWRGRTEMDNSSIASGCTADGLYGDSDNLRRVLMVQTFIDPLD